VETAKSEPGVFLVALEKVSNVIIVALERTMQEELLNVRYINRLVDDISDFFAEGEVSRIYINFCDPWPANRHAKRRLTGSRFLEIYKQILRFEGEIHFKTDNISLFNFSLSEFKNCGFYVTDVSYDLHEQGPIGFMTDYEMKFHEQGMPIYRCVAINQTTHSTSEV